MKSVTVDAKATPNASEIAIGIRNCAETLSSSSSGVKPAKVVMEVKMIGRKRATPAVRAAVAAEDPCLR